MKTGNILFFLAVIAACIVGYSYLRDTQPLETKHFEDYETEYKENIIVLFANQDTMKRQLRHFQADVDSLKANVDSLKAGQVGIYKAIKEGATKRNFIDEFLKEF